MLYFMQKMHKKLNDVAVLSVVGLEMWKSELNGNEWMRVLA